MVDTESHEIGEPALTAPWWSKHDSPTRREDIGAECEAVLPGDAAPLHEINLVAVAKRFSQQQAEQVEIVLKCVGAVLSLEHCGELDSRALGKPLAVFVAPYVEHIVGLEHPIDQHPDVGMEAGMLFPYLTGADCQLVRREL